MARNHKPVLKFNSVDTEFVGSKEEESIQERSLSSRNNLRKEMQEDIDAFINQGGAVEEVPRGMRADPPRKPVSNYGSRPI
jgi:hypothetical protein